LAPFSHRTAGGVSILTHTHMKPRLAPIGELISEGTAISPAVVFDKVSPAFDEHVVLREIGFTVPRGSMTILLGASGSGKSVLLKLILRS
jgi:ABC-type multidrug transport system fused ATPase/permease subunit